MEVEGGEGGKQRKEETKEGMSELKKKEVMFEEQEEEEKGDGPPSYLSRFLPPPPAHIPPSPPPPPRHRRRMCRWGRWRRAAGILPSPFLRPSSGLLQWSADNRRGLSGLRAAFGLGNRLKARGLRTRKAEPPLVRVLCSGA